MSTPPSRPKKPAGVDYHQTPLHSTALCVHYTIAFILVCLLLLQLLGV